MVGGKVHVLPRHGMAFTMYVLYVMCVLSVCFSFTLGQWPSSTYWIPERVYTYSSILCECVYTLFSTVYTYYSVQYILHTIQYTVPEPRVVCVCVHVCVMCVDMCCV